VLFIHVLFPLPPPHLELRSCVSLDLITERMRSSSWTLNVTLVKEFVCEGPCTHLWSHLPYVHVARVNKLHPSALCHAKGEFFRTIGKLRLKGKGRRFLSKFSIHSACWQEFSICGYWTSRWEALASNLLRQIQTNGIISYIAVQWLRKTLWK